MDPQPVSPFSRSLQAYIKVASFFAIFIGLAVLSGWAFDVPFLESILPGAATMKPNTAICFVALGVTLTLLRDKDAPQTQRRIAQIIAGFVLAIGLLTLAEYAFGWNLGIDQLLFRDLQTPADLFPGRMSPMTAALFVILVLVILLIETDAAQYLLLGAYFPTLFALIGYLFNYESLYRLFPFSSIAVHTAILFHLLSVALFAIRPDRVLMKTYLSPLAGGSVMRLLVWVIIAAVAFLGWLVERGEALGYFDATNETFFVVTSFIIIAWIVFFFGARMLIREENALRASEAQLKLAQTLAHIGNYEIRANGGGNKLHWSDEIYRIVGLTPAQTPDNPLDYIQRVVYPDDRERIGAATERIWSAGEKYQLEYRILRPDGNLAWVASIGQPIFDRAGRVVAVVGTLQDVTERKRAEQTIIERERQLNALVTSLDDIVFEFDEQGTYLNIWAADESKLAQPMAQILGRRIDDVLGQEIGRPFSEAVKRAVAEGRSEVIEYPLQVIGGLRWFMARVHPVTAQDGSHRTASMLVRDITERKLTDIALRERSVLLQTATDNASVGLVMLDPQRHYIFANQAYCRILGLPYEAEELIGRGPAEVLAEVYASQISPRLDRAFAGERVTYEMTRSRPDAHHGELSHYVVVYDPSRDESGRVDAVIVTIFDITEHKQAEEKLRQSETRFRSLVENGSDQISILDIEGRLLYESPSSNPLLGYPPGAYLGKSLFDLVHPGDMERVQRRFELLTRDANLHPREQFRLRHRDGTWRWVEAVGVNLSHAPEVGGIVINYHNITERKQAEEELQEARELFQKLFHQSPIPSALSRLSDRLIVDINAATEGLLGYARSEVIGKPSTDIDYWADPQARQSAYETVLREGALHEYEFKYRTKAGALGDALLYIETLDQRGEKYFVSTFVDITARKQAEQALRESEEKYAVTFDKSPFALALSKMPQATLVSVNDAFLDLFELTREEALGKTSVELGITDAESRAKVGAEFQARGNLHDFEVSRTTKTGRRLDLALSLDWVTIGGEKYILTTIRDITDRKRAEEQLRESEQRFRTAFNSSPISMGISSMQDGRFLSVNQAFLDFSGFTRDEMIGHTAFDLNIYADQQDRARLVQQLTEHGRVANLEMQIRIKSGAVRQVIAWAEKIELSGAPCILALTQDVTEQKQRERERETLLALATALRAAHSRDEMIPVILDQTIRLLNLDGAAFALLDQASGESVIELARGGLESWNRLHIPPGQGITGMVMASGETYVTNDLNTDPDNYRSDLIAGEICVACAPLIADQKTIGALWIRSASHMQDSDVRLLEGIANMSATAIHRATLFEQTVQSAHLLTEAYEKNIEGWSRALDLRDKETEGHTLRVTALTLELARAFGIPKAEIIHIRRGALLHDIGKMGVPDHILLKPGKLTEEEWVQMRLHPVFAYELLSPIEFLHDALDIPYCHHEKWDGTGYPRGLKGEEIPLAARLFTIVDVWDALTNDRPYRPAWPQEKALEYIREQSGTHFDPRAVEVFLSVIKMEEKGST